MEKSIHDFDSHKENNKKQIDNTEKLEKMIAALSKRLSDNEMSEL